MVSVPLDVKAQSLLGAGLEVMCSLSHWVPDRHLLAWLSLPGRGNRLEQGEQKQNLVLVQGHFRDSAHILLLTWCWCNTY